MEKFTQYEISPCVELDEGNITEAMDSLQAAEQRLNESYGKARLFWTLYGASGPGATEAIADVLTEEAAIALYTKITGLPLTPTGRSRRGLAAAPDWNLMFTEAAMCAWEHVLECRNRGYWRDQIHAHGTASIRLEVAQLGAKIEAAWLACEGWDAPFDWEFVPALLHRVIDIHGTHNATLDQYVAIGRGLSPKEDL